MLDELIELKQISPQHARLYQLFTSPMGKQCLMDIKDELFNEAPPVGDYSGEHFAWLDGRKSFVRSILENIKLIEALIAAKEEKTNE